MQCPGSGSIEDAIVMTARAGESYMLAALAEAEAAAARGEVPVGALLVRADGRILARNGNRMRELADPTAHAEMLVIRQPCAVLAADGLEDAALYVPLEPCAMCAAAFSFPRMGRFYFAAGAPRGGAVEHGACFFSSPACHHAPQVYGGIEEVR